MAHDDSTPGGNGAVSIRGVRWRAHVPSALIAALVLAMNGGTCSKQDEVAREVHELNTRVSRIEGAMGIRTASIGPNEGANGAGGTAAALGNRRAYCNAYR